MKDGLPPAMGLLAAAAAVSPEADRDVRVREAATRVRDWDEVLREGEGHGLLPLLGLALRGEAAAAVPDDALERIRARAAGTALANLELAALLATALDVLEAAGIAALTYKGPVLAESVYGDLGLRRFVDVDVLVRPRDALRAIRAMEAAGSRGLVSVPPGRERSFVRRADELEMVREGGVGSVDLQWAVVPRPFSVDLRVEDLLARAEPASIGGRSVLTLGAEDLVLVLCVHGSKHHWYRLLWVADVARVIVARPDLDWEVVLRRASELGARRMLLLGLLLARELMEAPLPEVILRAIAADPAATAVARVVVRERFGRPLGEDPEEDELTFDALTLRMRERFSDRARYLARNLFVPSVEDWQAVRLPAWMDWAYPVIRPIRLIGRYGRVTLARRKPPVGGGVGPSGG